MSNGVTGLPRELTCFSPAAEGACAVCGVRSFHNHFDRALHDLICIECWIPLRTAEDVCGALFFDAGPLRARELQERIEEFELSGVREVIYIWRRVRV